MGRELRRTDRLLLTVLLQVDGTDAEGVPFKEDARTTSINRYGASIRLPRPLHSGQVLHLLNPITRREADFRVVGSVSRSPDKNDEWGLECVNPNEDIWGIQFPPAKDGPPESKGLLECRQCHTVSFLRLTLPEVDVLEATGVLSRPCETCGGPTPWGYAEGSALTRLGAEVQAETPAAPPELSFRKHRRASLQLPLMIRKRSGDIEITKSENISKGGLCFISEKHYFPGEGIVVSCPYHPKSHNIEVEAQIVRQQPIEGTNRKIYGVRYLSEGQ